MLNFAANLSFLFQDIPFLDRFAAASRAGFKAVEYLFPYDHAPSDLVALLKQHGLTQALGPRPIPVRLVFRGAAAPGAIGQFVIIASGNDGKGAMHGLHIRVEMILRVAPPVVIQGSAFAQGVKWAADVRARGLAGWRCVGSFINVIAEMQKEI